MLRAQFAKAKADAETARSTMQRYADVLDKHSIRAPFSGVVIDKSAQPGEMISPLSAGGGYAHGHLHHRRHGSIEVEVDVNEAYIGRVKAGQRVDAVLDAYPNLTLPRR